MPNILAIVPVTVTSGSPAEVPGGVPVGAMGVTVHADWWANSPGPEEIDALTSNFAEAFTFRQTSTQGGPLYPPGNFVAWARVTSTGAGKTITPTFGWGVEEGPVFILVFWDGIPAAGDWVRPTGSSGADPRNWTITTSETNNVAGTIPSASTDMVLALDCCNGGTVPSNPAGWTSLQTLTVNSRSARLRRANSPGGSTTSTDTQLDNYASLGMIAVLDDGSGGEPPPSLSSPTATPTGTTTASGTVTTDKASGTLYFLASNNPSESAATIKASGGSQAVSATGVQNVTRGSLTPSTVYWLHYVHTTTDGDSNVVTSAPFITNDEAGTRYTPEIVGGTINFFDLGASASPSPVSIDVPPTAKFAVFCVDVAGYPGANSLTSVSTNFTGTPVYQNGFTQTAAALGHRVIVAPVTSTGNGKQITVAYAGANSFAPACMHVYFLDRVDLTYPVRGLPGFAGTADGATAATAQTTMAATDLVMVRDMRGDNASTYPGLGTGFTNLATTRGAAGSVGSPVYAISHRVKRVTTPSAGTASATTQNTLASSISVIAFRGAIQPADTTPPTLSSPTGTKTGSTTATGTVSTNEANGTAYAVVSTSATAPSAAQVQAGQIHTGAAAPWAGNQGVASTGVKTFNPTGLAPSTTYYIHFQHRDAAGNDSAVSTSASFTTDPPADVTPPTLSSPTGAATGPTTASGSVSTNEANGTLYRVTTVNATESAATVKAGASQAVSSTGVQNMGATGLSPSTTYRHHYLHRDAAGNDSAVVSSATFTTTASDTTPPTLSAASGTPTAHNTATGSVTTNEAGPAWAVLTTSATTPSAAQIKAGQTHTGAAAPAADTATLSVGSNPAAFDFSGLTGSTGYYLHVVQDDATGNVATPISSALFTTSAPPDTTAPTLSSGNRVAKSNALVVLGASTNEGNGTMYAVLTTSATPPSAAQVMAGQNHAGAAAVWSGNQSISSTGAKSFNATGLVQLTTYYPYVMHRDAAGNNSAVLSLGAVTTFRNGATGQYIWDNTAAGDGYEEGFLRNDVELPGDADKWFAWRYVTPPSNPGDWVINADGSFVYSGTVDASFTYQLEVDGVDIGGPTMVQAQAGERTATPANSRSPSTSTASNAIQTNQATAANSRSPSTSGASLVTQTHTATPANSNSPSRSTSAVAGQDNAATPANSVSPSTSTPSFATQNSIATPANSNSPSTSSSSSAYTPGVATPADSVSGSTSGSSTVSQDRYANPVDSVSGSTSEASTVTQTHVVVPADSAGPSTSRSSRAFNFNLTLDPDFAEYAFDDDEAAYYGE